MPVPTHIEPVYRLPDLSHLPDAYVYQQGDLVQIEVPVGDSECERYLGRSVIDALSRPAMAGWWDWERTEPIVATRSVLASRRIKVVATLVAHDVE